MSIDLINKIIKNFSFEGFLNILLSRITGSFKESFQNINDSFGWKSEPDNDVLEYIKNRQIVLSQKTQDRLHGNLKLELLEGINNRESITELTQRIAPLFDKMKKYELERIARTETIHAMNAGEFNAHVQAGVAKWKMWQAHKDRRTGSDSLRLDGQIQLIDQEFVDYETNNKCMFSPMRPNDRCSVVYLSKLPETIQKHGMMYKR